MFGMLSRNWWAVALRGAIAIIFGVLALFWPGITVAVLVIMFGAYALVDGIFALVSAFSGKNKESRGLMALIGVVGILFGLATLIWPGITAIALVFLIGAWAVVTGITEIVAAIRLRKEIKGEWLLIASGVISVVFGLLLWLAPGSGAIALAWLIGIYAIIFGVMLVALGFRLHKMDGKAGSTSATGTPRVA